METLDGTIRFDVLFLRGLRYTYRSRDLTKRQTRSDPGAQSDRATVIGAGCAAEEGGFHQGKPALFSLGGKGGIDVSATAPRRMTARSRRIAARRRDGRPAAGNRSPSKSSRPTSTKNGRSNEINLGISGLAKAGYTAPADAGRFDPVQTGYLDLMEPLNGDRRVGGRRRTDRPSGHTGRSPRVLGAVGVALTLGAAGAVAMHLVLFGRAKRHIGF